MQQRRTPSVAYGDSTLWDGAFGMEEKFPAKAQTFRVRQFRPLRRSRARFPLLSPAVTSSPGRGKSFLKGGAKPLSSLLKF